MSHRPTLQKRANKLRNALTRSPDAHIDLVDWLVDHHREGHRRPTKKQAQQMLLEGKVHVGSHKVGRLEIDLLGDKKWVLDPLLPAEQRDQIVVVK